MQPQTTVQCPKCGAIAEIENYYLGGYQWHKVAFCTGNRDHQTPLVWESGQYHAAVYQRQGLEYSIVRRDVIERQRAEQWAPGGP